MARARRYATPVSRDRPVALHRALALARVVDDRRRVVGADRAAGRRLLGRRHRPRLGELRERHVAQLGAPAAHVRAVGVVARCCAIGLYMRRK